MFTRGVFFIVLFLVTYLDAGYSNANPVGPAPAGDASTIARKVISQNELPCPKITNAARLKDGSIKAVCSNKEDYRVMSSNGQPIAMRCSVARKLGVKGC
jgi:hypothetical protein